MTPTVVIETPRLLLRRWRAEDAAPFAELNGDPQVMEHFPSTLTPPESDALMQRIDAHHDRSGFGNWAVEVKDVAPFTGFVGLSIPRFDAPFLPGVEIGWRMAQAHWGKGYVTEAARQVLAYGFATVGLQEIVSFTVEANERSWRVMQRIGMHRDPADDFDHPNIPEGHRLRRHLLYRLSRADWEKLRTSPTIAQAR